MHFYCFLVKEITKVWKHLQTMLCMGFNTKEICKAVFAPFQVSAKNMTLTAHDMIFKGKVKLR